MFEIILKNINFPDNISIIIILCNSTIDWIWCNSNITFFKPEYCYGTTILNKYLTLTVYSTQLCSIYYTNQSKVGPKNTILHQSSNIAWWSVKIVVSHFIPSLSYYYFLLLPCHKHSENVCHTVVYKNHKPYTKTDIASNQSKKKEKKEKNAVSHIICILYSFPLNLSPPRPPTIHDARASSEHGK